MAWTITIGEGDDAVVLDEGAHFSIKAGKNLNSNNDVESADQNIFVEGVVANDTPTNISARIAELLQQVTAQFNGVRVLIEQDGETWLDLQPSEGFVGPQIIEFETTGQEEGGAGQECWRYKFAILYKSKALQDDEDENIYELQTSIAVTKKNGKVVRKVWKASAKSTSSDAALASVVGFKPSEKYITEELEEFAQDARATGVWVWELESGGIKGWDCRVTYTGGRQGWVEVEQAGENEDPILFPAQRGALVIEVVGKITSYEQGITPPAEHFSESDTLVRDTSLEKTQEPEVFDRLRGEYTLQYHEVWKSFGPLPGTANHADSHNIIADAQEPGDGRAGS